MGSDMDARLEIRGIDGLGKEVLRINVDFPDLRDFVDLNARISEGLEVFQKVLDAAATKEEENGKCEPVECGDV